MMMKLIALVALGAVASAEDFVCPGDYGFYANPDNCIKYYQCTAGEAMPITCGLREFYWNVGNTASCSITLFKACWSDLYYLGRERLCILLAGSVSGNAEIF
jgi:hypothetical protein